MELLDAALAFALTMGALATIVTIIMETGHRLIKIRERNLIRVLQTLGQELTWLGEDERWKLVAHSLNNPGSGYQGLPEETPDHALGGAMMKCWWWRRITGVYDAVSLEHVLRRVAELPTMKSLAAAHPERAAAELDRVARRYQEIRSGSSASFKRRAQMWSLLVGVAFALIANVDAVRIFNTYKTDNKVAAKIIAQQGKLEKSAEETEKKLAALKKAEEEQQAAETKLDDSKKQASKEQLKVLEKAVASAEEKVEKAQLDAQAAHKSFHDLIQLGVPIGWDYWPYGFKDSPVEKTGITARQPDAQNKHKYVAGAYWIFNVVFAGLLIGLGAPFWFDVAKRLAEVRKAFGGKSSAEIRLSGKDEAVNTDDRKKLMGQIVKDVRDDSDGAGGLGAPDATIARVQTLLTELGEIQESMVEATGLLDLPTRTAIDRFLDKHFAPEDRALIFGAMTDPDFFPRLINELEVALNRNAA